MNDMRTNSSRTKQEMTKNAKYAIIIVVLAASFTIIVPLAIYYTSGTSENLNRNTSRTLSIKKETLGINNYVFRPWTNVSLTYVDITNSVNIIYNGIYNKKFYAITDNDTAFASRLEVTVDDLYMRNGTAKIIYGRTYESSSYTFQPYGYAFKYEDGRWYKNWYYDLNATIMLNDINTFLLKA